MRRLRRFEAPLARAREHKHAVFGNVPRDGGRHLGRKIEESERGGEGGVRGLGHGVPWIECLLFRAPGSLSANSVFCVLGIAHYVYNVCVY